MVTARGKPGHPCRLHHTQKGVSVMVGLLDIGESVHKVTIRGKELDVYGIPVGDLVALIGRFPDLRKVIERRAGDIDPEAMMKLAPEIIAAVIAAGIAEEGDDDKTRAKSEAVAAKLSIGEQVSAITVIFKATFPQGVGSFVDELAALSSGVPAPAPVQNDGTASSGKSPKESKGSSASETSPKK